MSVPAVRSARYSPLVADSRWTTPSVRRWVRRIAGWRLARPLVRASGYAGLLPLGSWWKLPAPTGTFRVWVGLRHFRYVSSPGDQVAAPLYWAGVRGWEAETFRVFTALARSSDHLLDVGAYTGVFTVVAATVNPRLRAVAFEPNPARFRSLEHHLALNGLEGRCRGVRAALGPEAGSGELFVPDDDDSSATLVDRRGDEAGVSVLVDIVPPDAVVPDAPRVDLVKIDVEGTEGAVLEALLPRLRRDMPAIICEFLGASGHDLAESVLHQLGYRRWHLSPRGPVPVPRVGAQPSPFHNFLCLPEHHPFRSAV